MSNRRQRRQHRLSPHKQKMLDEMAHSTAIIVESMGCIVSPDDEGDGNPLVMVTWTGSHFLCEEDHHLSFTCVSDLTCMKTNLAGLLHNLEGYQQRPSATRRPPHQ